MIFKYFFSLRHGTQTATIMVGQYGTGNNGKFQDIEPHHLMQFSVILRTPLLSFFSSAEDILIADRATFIKISFLILLSDTSK